MHLGRRAVDLVGEQQIGEYGPQRRREVARLLVVDAGADQVRGHEVRRELDPAKRPANDLRERLDRQSLREPRHAFHEEVALGKDGHQHALEEMILSDDHFLDFIKNALHQRRNVAATVLSVFHTLLAQA